MKPLRTLISEWNVAYSDRSKLQHVYASLAVLSLVVAGIIGLINYRLGQSLLFGSVILALVFIGNSVIWALIHTFIISAAPVKPPQAKKK